LAAGGIMKGWALAAGGKSKSGISMMREGLDSWRQTGAVLLTMYFAGMIAEACGAAGQTREALATLDEQLAGLESTGGRVYAAELYRLKGALMLGQLGNASSGPDSRQRPKKRGDGVEEEARTYLLKALETARDQGTRIWELRAAISLVRASSTKAEEQQARKDLEGICGWFPKGSKLPDLQEAKALL
jgi:adenylate cyclase